MHALYLLSRGLALAAIAVVSSPATATPIAAVTACDQVTINGNSYTRYTLQITNTSPSLGACVVNLSHPQADGEPADSCSFVQSSAPPGWASFGSLWFVNVDDEEPCLDAGESLDGFQLVLTRACCFDVELSNVLEPFAFGEICLQCPTPTKQSTWGELKARYR